MGYVRREGFDVYADYEEEYARYIGSDRVIDYFFAWCRIDSGF